MTVNPRPPGLAPEWLEYYRRLRPATIGRIVDEGFVDGAIRPIFKRISVVGTAVTCKLPEDDTALTLVAIDHLRPGDVLVLDHGGQTRVACWGELLSLAAWARGCVGVIVDGAVADVVEIEDQRMPTFARAVSALAGRHGPGGGGVNIPVQCGGVAVHPGDLIVADDNGIVAIPPGRIEEVGLRAAAAEDRAPFERAWVRRGGSWSDLEGREAPDVQRMLRERGWA